MGWRADPHPAVLLDRAGTFLAGDPLRNNVLGTVLAARRDRLAEPDGQWLYAQRAGAVVAVATRTPPRALLLSAMSEADAIALARYAAECQPPLPSIDGPAGPSGACAAEYGRLVGRAPRPGLHSRLLRLDRPVLPEGVPGSQRGLREDDADLLARWLAAFAAEATPNVPTGDPRADMRRWLAVRDTYLWEDGGVPVSLVMVSAPMAGLRRVGPVYTPPERRGRGYAAANVATAGMVALAGGATGLMLYADATNPVSNRVYERIGYRALDESREWLFDGG